MFEVSAWELMVIASLALIVIGPKELPRVVRSVGKWMQKLRSIARQFQRSMEDAAREFDLQDLKKVTDARKTITDEVRSIGTDAERALDGKLDASAKPRREAAPKHAAPPDRPIPPERAALLDPEDDIRRRQFERGVRERPNGGFGDS